MKHLVKSNTVIVLTRQGLKAVRTAERTCDINQLDRTKSPSFILLGKAAEACTSKPNRDQLNKGLQHAINETA